ncbi:hypothetical protein KUV46_00550 [Thalassovita mediterranea]|nr:hypothetical protein KUV46_00550 [Thalassovita mediterranea]
MRASVLISGFVLLAGCASVDGAGSQAFSEGPGATFSGTDARSVSELIVSACEGEGFQVLQADSESVTCASSPSFVRAPGDDRATQRQVVQVSFAQAGRDVSATAQSWSVIAPVVSAGFNAVRLDQTARQSDDLEVFLVRAGATHLNGTRRAFREYRGGVSPNDLAREVRPMNLRQK